MAAVAAVFSAQPARAQAAGTRIQEPAGKDGRTSALQVRSAAEEVQDAWLLCDDSCIDGWWLGY